MKKINLLFFILFVSCSPNTDSNKVMKDSNLKELKTPDELYPQLFKDVQLKQIFPDGKTFVDCNGKFSDKEINNNYQKLLDTSNKGILEFVKEHFEVPGLISSNFESDSNRTPTEHVNALWDVLTREADSQKDGSTLIPLPKSYIVPGGRFREVYYWDSYFTMLGLVESNRFDIIENMLDNFAFLINRIGHIPNGNRVYYKTRSQPPFFSQMVALLAENKGDVIFLDG